MFAKHSVNFITIISLISVAGIFVGSAALVCVTSIFNGFRGLVETTLVNFDPHIRITDKSGSIIHPDSVISRLTSYSSIHSSIVAASAAVSSKMIVQTSKGFTAFELRGIDVKNAEKVSGLAQALVAGEFRLHSESSTPHIILGLGLAAKLRVGLGDTLSLISPKSIESAITRAVMPQTHRMIIVGFFQSNNKDYDMGLGYCDGEIAREVMRLPTGEAQSIEIRCRDFAESEHIRDELNTVLSEPSLRIETWYDLHRDLYAIMRFERMASFSVIALVVLVAVFNIFASLTMIVREKRSEIGILKALGMTDQSIKQVFLIVGFSIGGFATTLGAGAGVLLCLGQIHFQWFALDTSRYIVPAIPVQISPYDVVLVVIVGCSMALIAGWFPAQIAARIRSASALLRAE